MSQASRSRARTLERWRRQAARLVAINVEGHVCPRGRVTGNNPGKLRIGALLSGQTFDVAEVRALCERLVSEGERRAAERAVFEDWTRDQGLGPERCVGFIPDLWCYALVTHERDRLRAQGWAAGPLVRARLDGRRVRAWPLVLIRQGGWPGRLACTWGTIECKACRGSGRIEATLGDPPRATTLGCAPCRGRGRTPRPAPDARHRDAASGPGLARTAQRLLDTLDGRCPWAPSAGWQESECKRCRGVGGWDDHGVDGEQTDQWFTCDDCNATGHNLRGVLAAVEASPQQRRALADAAQQADRPSGVDLRQAFAIEALESASHEWDIFGTSTGWTDRTRVAPRGEHRQSIGDAGARGHLLRDQLRGMQAAVDASVSEPLAYAAHVRAWLRTRLPAWRRGELKHAAQRRARATRWQELMVAHGQRLDQIGAVIGLDRLSAETDTVFRERLRDAAGLGRVYGGSGLVVELDDA